MKKNDLDKLSEEDKKSLQEEKPFTYLILTNRSLTEGSPNDEPILGYD